MNGKKENARSPLHGVNMAYDSRVDYPFHESNCDSIRRASSKCSDTKKSNLSYDTISRSNAQSICSDGNSFGNLPTHMDSLHKRDVSNRTSMANMNRPDDTRANKWMQRSHKQSQYEHCDHKLTEDVCSMLSNVALVIMPILLLDDPLTMNVYNYPNCSQTDRLSDVCNSNSTITDSSMVTLSHKERNIEAEYDSASSSSIFNLVKEAYEKHRMNHNHKQKYEQSLFSESSSKLLSQGDARRHSQRLEQSSIKRSIQTPEFRKFVYELLRKTRMSSIALLLALKYIHKLRVNHPHACPSHGCEYRLFSVALILANKYLEDKTFSNKTWSSLTRIQVHEINVMEREFLNILDYHLDIPDDEFIAWIGYVEHTFQLYSQAEGDTFSSVETISTVQR